MNISDAQARTVCTYADKEMDQSKDAFSDLLVMETLKEELEGMDKAQTQRFIIGLALTKPFMCEENHEFNNSEYDTYITQTSETLNRAGCYSDIKPKRFVEGRPNLSMEDRINHIYMSKKVQKKLGCTRKVRRVGSRFRRTKYAQKSVRCEF